MKYRIILRRVIEHETSYIVHAESEEEAVDYTLSGDYDEIVEDCEQGEMEDPDVIDVVKIS